MNNQFFAAAVVCLIGLTSSAPAAVVPILTVTFPHAVMVGGTTLPAGKYSVLDMQDHGGTSVFLFFSDSGRSASFLVNRIDVPGHQAADKTEVVIVNEGEKYTVDKIWLGGLEHGYQVQTEGSR